MTNNFNNLVPVYLCSDADRLAVAEDNVLCMHMLRAKIESDLSDMDMDFEESEPVQPIQNDRKLSHKQRRAARRVQNARHKSADRRHGKRRSDSTKNLRRWENDQAQMERPQVLWCQNHKGEYVPSKIIDRKYHEKRLNESAQSQFDHTPFDEDVWDFVAELPDPLEEEKVEDYWNSPSDFLTTTSVFQEDAWMYLNRGGHYVLVETGKVYYEDGDGQHGEYWERETVIY